MKHAITLIVIFLAVFLGVSFGSYWAKANQIERERDRAYQAYYEMMEANPARKK